MTIWDVLEIEETRDKKTIKKAYAIKLKKTRADEHPKEFQELKEAFDSALKFSEQGPKEEENKIIKQVVQADLMEDELGSISEEIILETIETEKTFMQEVYLVVQNYETRIDIDVWRKVCELNGNWEYHTFVEKQRVICQVLSKYFKIMPRSIILFLFEHFELLSLKTSHGPDETINKFVEQLKQIYEVPNFQFLNYSKIPKEERDDYYVFRYDYYYNLNVVLSSNFNIKEMFEKAEATQVEDADFLNLLAQTIINSYFPKFIRERRIKKYVKQALEIDKTNPTSNFLHYYYQAVRNYKISKKGIKFLESKPIINIESDLQLCLSGFIYYYGLDNYTALECWERVINPRFAPAFQEEVEIIRASKAKETEKANNRAAEQAKRDKIKKEKEAEEAKKRAIEQAERIAKKKARMEELSLETEQNSNGKWKRWLYIFLLLAILAVGFKSYYYIKGVDGNQPNISEKQQKSINKSIEKPKLDLNGR
ncbi:hypothetical protein [Listeria seeligeri]|uniref:hypothetical protein n=1 Tax=Listeria seeligeri TaxID=1640 RepID=UPI001624AA01|nr:hypothetical protein [Listeria seeligeri]MBC1430042.1 hypothetical protein [Listeria seeligeri]MBF2562807.1 hypothetical protein [Listeria seeligeri]